VPANLAGTAAISLPFGRLTGVCAKGQTRGQQDGQKARQENGKPLPISLQVISPRFEDVRLLAAAQRIEEFMRGLEEEAAAS
jgi:Asp-tRNA(Asn)/Glu-tRNA(Gln) amidotransferase A subunit family amidase